MWKSMWIWQCLPAANNRLQPPLYWKWEHFRWMTECDLFDGTHQLATQIACVSAYRLYLPILVLSSPLNNNNCRFVITSIHIVPFSRTFHCGGLWRFSETGDGYITHTHGLTRHHRSLASWPWSWSAQASGRHTPAHTQSNDDDDEEENRNNNNKIWKVIVDIFIGSCDP